MKCVIIIHLPLAEHVGEAEQLVWKKTTINVNFFFFFFLNDGYAFVCVWGGGGG